MSNRKKVVDPCVERLYYYMKVIFHWKYDQIFLTSQSPVKAGNY